MFKHLYVYFVFLYLFPFLSTTQSEINEELSKKLFGGVPAFKNETNHIAVFYIRPLFSSTTQNCAGTVISSSHILTANHCFSEFQKYYPLYMKTIIKLYGDENRIAREIKYVYNYSSDRRELKNDLALVKFYPELNEEIAKNISKNIAIISPISDTFANVYGYKSQPEKSNLKILPWNTCSKIYNINVNSMGRICVGPRDNNTKTDVCRGESGSGLIINDTVVGIVSGGVNCTKGFPGIYTDVAYYHEWIEKNKLLNLEVDVNHSPYQYVRDYINTVSSANRLQLKSWILIFFISLLAVYKGFTNLF